MSPGLNEAKMVDTAFAVKPRSEGRTRQTAPIRVSRQAGMTAGATFFPEKNSSMGTKMVENCMKKADLDAVVRATERR